MSDDGAQNSNAPAEDRTDMAEDRTEMAKNRTDYAEDRTDYAEDRTILANERTFAGWSRTAFAAIGIGLGFQALFREIEPAWIPKIIATIFFALAIFIIWNAQRKATLLVKRLDIHEVEVMGSTNFRVIAIAVTIAAIGVSSAILLLT